MRLGTTKSRAPSGVDFMRYGVSISKKERESRYLRVSMPSWWRNMRLARRGFLLKSRKRHCMRRSSPPSLSSSMVNGGVLAALSTSIFSTIISISPVGILAFLEERSITLPVTFTTNSRPSLRAARQRDSSVSRLNTNCVMP